jgi:hypothetical protein
LPVECPGLPPKSLALRTLTLRDAWKSFEMADGRPDRSLVVLRLM